MALDLNLQPIGTGVSDAEQAKFLVEHGCLEMQGPLFSPGLEAKDFRRLLGAGLATPTATTRVGRIAAEEPEKPDESLRK